MSRPLACASFALALAAAPTLARAADTIAAILADFERYDRQVDPIGAGANGDREALSRLPDDSPAAEARNKAALEGFRRRLAGLGPARLPGEDEINRELLTREVSDRLEALGFDADRMNFDSYDGFHLTFTELAQSTPIRDGADARAYVARLNGAARYYDAEIANARRGVATGFTQPRPTVAVVLDVVRKQVATPVGESPLLAPLQALPPSIPPAEAATLKAQALQAITTQVKPAQQRLLAFLETEYLPHARASLAARDLPNGAAYYAWRVREDTTTDLTPDQIHALGLSEVARIRKEMEALIASTGFTGSFRDYQDRLRTDPRYYAKTPDELLERSALFDKETDKALPRFFNTLPRLPFTVAPIPAESAEGATTAYYEQGSPALGLAGTYRVNTTHLDQRPLYEIPALSLHESAPGHHVQIALAQERTDLPRFRRDAYLVAFEEGWALYSEHLGVEMGRYRTPEENFGRLSYEMWRACRLVADTGIHWLRWSREEARQCFTENTALSPKNIEVELDRYISWPGQALAYKIGELKIRELRAKAEAALGPRFDVRRFHDAVLLEGPLPLDVLQRHVDDWIAAEKALNPSPPAGDKGARAAGVGG